MIADLTRTMFYKAGFDVCSEDGRDVLWTVICDLREWLGRKARRDGYDFPMDNPTWTQVKQGGKVTAEGARVSIVSRMHVEGDVYTWACRLEEIQTDPNGKAPRTWVTEMGFLGESHCSGKIFIALSYGDRPGFIGELQDPPTQSVPGLISILLDDTRLLCTVSGVEARTEPHEISDAAASYRLIADPQRETPVILVAPNAAGDPAIDPQRLASVLGPNAIVLHTRSIETLNELNDLLLPYNLHCYRGAMRIFFAKPDLANLKDSNRHRFISQADLIDKGAEKVVSMLVRALAQDVYFWQSAVRVEDVIRLNKRSSRERQYREQNQSIQDSVLDDLIEAETLRDEALEENESLRSENQSLRSKCENYEAAFSSDRSAAHRHAAELLEFVQGMPQLPSGPLEVAKLAVKAFPDKIAFTERGWDSLDDCPTNASVLWSALHDMCTILHPLYADSSSVDMVAAFNSRSNFTLARGEGAQTRKDSKLMDLRKDTFMGREINIEPHIRSSQSNPGSDRFLRVYFAWDEPSKMIVIGSCGEHLDNSTTRSRK